jgi:hypothetical protein
VVQQDNGELQQDVIDSSLADGGWLDEEISDSFPASDPLSHWAGPPRPTSEADRARPGLVQHHPVGDTPEGDHPE